MKRLDKAYSTLKSSKSSFSEVQIPSELQLCLERIVMPSDDTENVRKEERKRVESDLLLWNSGIFDTSIYHDLPTKPGLFKEATPVERNDCKRLKWPTTIHTVACQTRDWARLESLIQKSLTHSNAVLCVSGTDSKRSNDNVFNVFDLIKLVETIDGKTAWATIDPYRGDVVEDIGKKFEAGAKVLVTQPLLGDYSRMEDIVRQFSESSGKFVIGMPVISLKRDFSLWKRLMCLELRNIGELPEESKWREKLDFAMAWNFRDVMASLDLHHKFPDKIQGLHFMPITTHQRQFACRFFGVHLSR